MITCRAAFDADRALVRFVAALLRANRRAAGTRWGRQALTCWWQAVLVLRWFRSGTRVADLARDARIGRVTAAALVLHRHEQNC